MNKKAIIDAIKNDATLTNLYSDYNGDMCVIGGLAFECGISKEYLRKCGEIKIDRTPAKMIKMFQTSKKITQAKNLGRVRRVIKETFGLSVENLKKLQNINDDEDNTIERRKKLILYVESI